MLRLHGCTEQMRAFALRSTVLLWAAAAIALVCFVLFVEGRFESSCCDALSLLGGLFLRVSSVLYFSFLFVDGRHQLLDKRSYCDNFAPTPPLPLVSPQLWAESDTITPLKNCRRKSTDKTRTGG